MKKPSIKLMSFQILNLVILALTINIACAAEPEVQDGNGLIPSDLAFQKPTAAQMAALMADTRIDADHKRKLLLCLSDLEKKIRELMQQPQAKLSELLEARADMALLRVAKSFLELQTIEKRHQSGDAGATDRRLRAIGSGLGADRAEMAGNLDSFYQYISLQDQTNAFAGNDAEAKLKQDKLLDALEAFSKKHTNSTFRITAADKYIIKNLYSKYQPSNLPAGETSLLETIFNQLGRNFKSRDLGDSDSVSLTYQMTCSGSNCTKVGALTRFNQAKAAFVAHMKSELKKFMKDPDKNHNCKDFYNPDTLKFNPQYRPFETYMCSAGNFMRGLSDTTPFNNITDILNFMSPDRFNPGPINPQMHARRLFHNLLSCKFKKKAAPNPNNDWEVELELYMEHLHGTNESNTNWFINTGKLPTEENGGLSSGGIYNNCDRAGSSYRTYDFASSPKCIDRPVHHASGAKHADTFKVTVNLGDTRQSIVTLRGTAEPRSTRGVAIRPRAGPGQPPNPRVEGTDQNGAPQDDNVSTRELSLSECTGSGSYAGSSGGSAVVTGIEILDAGAAPLRNLGLRPAALHLQARTIPALTGGRYHWSCEPASVAEESAEMRRACSQVTTYPTVNAEFPRISEDYTVKVQYTSSVQRPEAPTATKLIPKRKPITFEFQVVPEESNATQTTVKLVYTGEENTASIIDSGTLRWKTCPSTPGHPAVLICGPGKSIALDTKYTFPFAVDSFQIEAEWKWAPLWPAVKASKMIGNTEIEVNLREISSNATNVIMKPTVSAPTSGDVPENSKSAITGRLKWSCAWVGPSTAALPVLCNDQNASVESDTTFPRLTQAYTVTAVTSKKNNAAFIPLRSNTLSVPALDSPLFGTPVLASNMREKEGDPNKVQIQVTLSSSNSNPLPAHELNWSCTTPHPGCSGAVTLDEWKDFEKETLAYPVTAVYTSTGNGTQETSETVPAKVTPVVLDKAVARVSLEPLADPAVNTNTHTKLKTELRHTPATGRPIYPRTSYKWSCEPDQTGCAGDIEGNEGLKTFERKSENYDVKVTYIEDGGPGDSANFTILKLNTPIARVTAEKNEAATNKATHVQAHAKYFFEGTGEAPVKQTFKWICPTGKSCTADIAAALNTFSDWKDFERDATSDYVVTAEFVSVAGQRATATITVPKKEAAESYRIEVSEDKTPDADTAKFQAYVFKNGEVTDVSEEGEIHWVYKSPDGAEIKKDKVNSIEAERGKDDIKENKVYFQKGEIKSPEVDFVIKKKKASEEEEDEGIPPLPEIPPSPAPPRFQPMILPPPPGMFITPGFD